MAYYVGTCPRCGTREITFDVKAENCIGWHNTEWQRLYETFCKCRHCRKCTIFLLYLSEYRLSEYVIEHGLIAQDASLNPAFGCLNAVPVREMGQYKTPDHLPEQISKVFEEAVICLNNECWNASAAMFRGCLDHATKQLMPSEDEEGLNAKTRRSLGLRLEWLFKTGRLPEALSQLADTVKEDGNDGAHDNNLTPEDAENLYDFTFLLLERLYTEPKKLQLASERRAARRTPPAPKAAPE